MKKNDIEAEVKRIVANVARVPKKQIRSDAKLSETYGIDSLDSIEIADEIELEFKIQVPDEALERFETIQSIVTAIAELSGAQEAA